MALAVYVCSYTSSSGDNVGDTDGDDGSKLQTNNNRSEITACLHVMIYFVRKMFPLW